MENLQLIIPELFISIMIMFLLIFGVFKKNSSQLVYNLTTVSLVAALALIINLDTQIQSSLFNNSYNIDNLAKFMKILLILSGISIIQNPIGGLLFVPSFILYINHFQIIPEENAMLDLFEDNFLKYKENVRRWI